MIPSLTNKTTNKPLLYYKQLEFNVCLISNELPHRFHLLIYFFRFSWLSFINPETLLLYIRWYFYILNTFFKPDLKQRPDLEIQIPNFFLPFIHYCQIRFPLRPIFLNQLNSSNSICFFPHQLYCLYLFKLL